LAEVRQNLGMVQHAIIIETRNFGTWVLRAVGATSDIRLCFRTGSHGAFAAECGNSPATDAAITQQVFPFELHLRARKLFHERFKFLFVLFLRSEIHGAGAAIKSAGRNQAFAATFLRLTGCGN
jgi:hypothetical protein